MSPPQQLNEFLYILCVTGKKSNKNIISLGNIDTSIWRVLAVGVQCVHTLTKYIYV